MNYRDAVTDGIQRLLEAGIAADEARTEARLLLLHVTQWTPEAWILRQNEEMPPSLREAFTELVRRRAGREPLAYLTGERGFYGLTFRVTPAVLIPRPETELLVETVLRHIGDHSARIVDVGTGSGCIAVSIAKNAPRAQVFATDVSMEALVIAGGNVARNRLSGFIALYQGDLLGPVKGFAPFEVIVSNPPYIAPDEIAVLEPEVRDHEPRIALGTNPDALHFYRRFAAEAPSLLASGGLLAVEVGQGQAEAVMALWRGAGLTDVAAIADYAGILRVVVGIKV